MFTDIVMIDYRRPISERAKSRKVCGPYHWSPRDASKSSGFGFYQSSNKLAMDRHGSIADLRLEPANDHLDRYSRLWSIDGYYCDADCMGETLQPIVARLAHGRGFLAGWTMGKGMCASLMTAIYDDARDAAMAAHDDAEQCAEREIEREEAQAGEED